MKTASVLELKIPNQYHPLILLIKEQKPRSKEMRRQHLNPPQLNGSTVYHLVFGHGEEMIPKYLRSFPY